ncbi:DUF1643 domain-containing protein (plasmid) [Paracoccus sp. TK19116]|uniref:DUF1643 domain-containing protein n=1 Tax=Paracoccus albicereus TaxID=2922394 RepID=A0ABT1MM76_9RHOB|nr:DUF1643 domain-containing protein [Paracoccus albicereus]MCQ0969281.1 DUF1643 domain-containing protein [Paracoccus albicereus]
MAVIERHHDDGATRSSALYSACETYRYALTREWAEGPRLVWVMLNPSTADERRNDPTIARCERRARLLGYGAFRVVNLFAFRATRPQDLKAASAPIGPLNDATLHAAAAWGSAILCGWGIHGGLKGRGPAVLDLLRSTGRPLYHLGLTAGGAPRHPLYLSYDKQPQAYTS